MNLSVTLSAFGSSITRVRPNEPATWTFVQASVEMGFAVRVDQVNAPISED